MNKERVQRSTVWKSEMPRINIPPPPPTPPHPWTLSNKFYILTNILIYYLIYLELINYSYIILIFCLLTEYDHNTENRRNRSLDVEDPKK